MPLVTRQGKGSRLTIQEMDDNLLYLEELAENAASGNFEEVTYSQLATKIGASELVVGRYYKITDFKSCYDQPNFNVYGSPINTGNYKEAAVSPIIVLAIATDKLHAQAFQPEFPSDVIKYDVLFNTTEITSGVALGRITERIDEYNNRTDYDHRFIEFRRYNLFYYDAKSHQKTGTIQIDSTTAVSDYYTATVIGTGTSFNTDVAVNDIIAIPSMSGSGDISLQFCKVTSITSDTEMTIEGYSLSTVPSLTKWFSTGVYTDLSYKMNNIVGDATNFNEYTLFENIEGSSSFFNNYFGNTNNLGYDFNLSNNVVLDGPFSNNTFKDGCRNNTFEDDMTGNTVGYDFSNNSITNDFDENIIGNDFFDNVIIQDFQNNIIGSDFYRNLITGEFRDNHVGEEFYENMISTNSSTGFWRNQIGNQFYNNIMITNGDFQNNVIGNGFNNNEIYNNFYKNRVGVGFNNNNTYNEFVDNVIGNGFNGNNTYFSFESNDIDNYFEDNTIYAYFNDNTIGEGFFSNNLGSDGNTINFYKNTIRNNTANNTISVNFEENSIENDFSTNSILKDTSNNGECLRNQLGNDFVGNTIYAYFNDNTIGAGFDNNDLGTNASSINFNRNSININCENNTIDVIDFDENSIENDFKGNGIAKDLSNNGSFLRNQIGNDFSANLINGHFRDNKIKNGFIINDINGDFDYNSIGNNFDTNTTAQSFSHNEIGHGFYSNTIAEGFGYGGGSPRGNKIGNNFANNIIGEYFYDNIIIDGFTNNTVPDDFRYNQVLTSIGSVNFDTEAGVKAITFSTPTASDGTYVSIASTGGTGTDATFTITVSGGIVSDVAISSIGRNYTVSDSLTISAGGFMGSGDITVTVTQICSSPMVVGDYNCTILKDVASITKLTALDSDGTLYVAPSITSEYI